jgi:hypothetical protein
VVGGDFTKKPTENQRPTMKFEKGNKAAKGGRRNPPGGRPTKAQAVEKESFRQALERQREERAQELASAYYDTALSDPATLRHCVDKVLPTLTEENIIAPMTVTFLQFCRNSPQLSASGIPAPILVGDGKQEQSEREAAPPPPAKLKFHDFSNGKRRQ